MVGWGNFLSIFWPVHDISRTFEFVTPLGGSTFLDLNNSKLNPHVHANFGRDPMVMSKRGDTDTHTRTKGH